MTKKLKSPSREQLVRLVNQIRREMMPEIPAKRWTKVSAKPNSFKRNLKGVPGGSIWDMAEAKETGTILGKVISEAESAQNSYTTRGNYII